MKSKRQEREGASMSRADEEREAKLSRFRSELRREPTDDEWSLLYATHAIDAPFGTIQIPKDFLGLIIEVVKEAERRGARKA